MYFLDINYYFCKKYPILSLVVFSCWCKVTFVLSLYLVFLLLELFFKFCLLSKH